MWERLKTMFQALLDIFVSRGESAIGNEAMLRQRRNKRGERVKKMGENVDDVGQYAEKATDMLADTRREYENFLAQAEQYLADEQKYLSSGQEALVQRAKEDAQMAVNQAAELEDDIQELEVEMKDALKNHQQVIDIVLRESRKWAKMGYEDSRRLSNHAREEIRKASQKSREELIALIPQDEGNDYAQRMDQQTDNMRQRNNAREKRLQAYEAAENAKGRAEAMKVTAKSATLMEQLKKKAGYASPEAAPAETSASEMAAKIAAMKKE